MKSRLPDGWRRGPEFCGINIPNLGDHWDVCEMCPVCLLPIADTGDRVTGRDAVAWQCLRNDRVALD
jgi:hypothetical protein